MGRIYKVYTREKGKPPSACWYISYTDERGHVVQRRAYRTLNASRNLLDRMEREVAARKAQ